MIDWLGYLVIGMGITSIVGVWIMYWFTRKHERLFDKQ